MAKKKSTVQIDDNHVQMQNVVCFKMTTKCRNTWKYLQNERCVDTAAKFRIPWNSNSILELQCFQTMWLDTLPQMVQMFPYLNLKLILHRS